MNLITNSVVAVAGGARVALLALWLLPGTQSGDSGAREEALPTPAELYRAGSAALQRGDIQGSLDAFDALVVARPDDKPHLWQRGIALYYAGRFADCVDQFESHRSVNVDDVENATWHYLCVSAIDGADAARERLFPADDRRIPLMSVHRLYAGAIGPDAVFEALASQARTPEQLRVGGFYAHLYVALWYESQGNRDRTLVHLELALAGAEIGHYMESVARLHLDRMQQEPKATKE